MIIYGLYKNICSSPSDISTWEPLMAHYDPDELRQLANKYFADPANFVTRHKRQLTIPDDAMKSNVESSDGGGQTVYVFADIRVMCEVRVP